MDLKQLTIVIEKGGSNLQFDPGCEMLVAQYNPSKMGFTRTVGWQNQQATGKDQCCEYRPYLVIIAHGRYSQYTVLNLYPNS